jgi:hypothetical protein
MKTVYHCMGCCGSKSARFLPKTTLRKWIRIWADLLLCNILNYLNNFSELFTRRKVEKNFWTSYSRIYKDLERYLSEWQVGSRSVSKCPGSATPPYVNYRIKSNLIFSPHLYVYSSMTSWPSMLLQNTPDQIIKSCLFSPTSSQSSSNTGKLFCLHKSWYLDRSYSPPNTPFRKNSSRTEYWNNLGRNGDMSLQDDIQRKSALGKKSVLLLETRWDPAVQYRYQFFLWSVGDFRWRRHVAFSSDFIYIRFCCSK